ncbi:tripartite tricarboxylate transporter permease [Thermococcus zilligii]|uniref:tripartite tricarboxylate transporter permease n=1 Tax=Thermococcus zilligii TaxID=54076 RepID=UPI00029A9399|nr:tripartite tricarboxylate transporter permease [Thermococcus zilligii]
MLWELLKGLILGTFTGLTPGIHVNTLAEMGGSFFLLFAMGLTHTFMDAFPSTFLGVPEEGTALSVLPAHRLVLSGRGGEAIEIALWASLLAVFFSIPLSVIYPTLAKGYSPEIGRTAAGLLLVFLLLTAGKGKKTKTLVIMALSGLLGIAVLRGFPVEEPFYHLFTGLFGIPIIISALESRDFPEQEAQWEIDVGALAAFSFAGTLIGMISSLLPAFTASMGAAIATAFSKGERNFLAAAYSINTANFFFGVINYSLTGRTRNGVTVAMSRNGVTVPGCDILFLSALFVGFLAVLAGMALLGVYVKFIRMIPYTHLNLAVIVLLIALSLYFDGLSGLWVLATSSLVGYLAGVWGVRRTSCMAVLIVPLIIGV